MTSIQDARSEAEKENYSKAETLYCQIIKDSAAAQRTETQLSLLENAIIELGQLYSKQEKSRELKELIEKCQQMLNFFAKSKTSKILRSLIDSFEKIPNSVDQVIEITQNCIEWCKEEKRLFLRQALQLRLANYFFIKTQYQESLEIINQLSREFKKLDDKSSLVEIQLLESKNYFNLKNYAKSRAALTAAKTSANSIYCPSSLQAELDLTSGILNAQDKDFSTAYSYFYEAFENYQLSSDEVKTIKVVKYMLLCKIMLGLISDVNSLVAHKNVAQFTHNKQIEAMVAIAKAHDNKSLKEFEAILSSYSDQLTQDVIIRLHLKDLYDSLFSSNLLKLIEPYSVIEISHISSMIGLSDSIIEGKLSQMILDKVFYGVLDQGNNCLIVYEEPQLAENYDTSLSLIKNMSTVVDLLYSKASTLN